MRTNLTRAAFLAFLAFFLCTGCPGPAKPPLPNPTATPATKTDPAAEAGSPSTGTRVNKGRESGHAPVPAPAPAPTPAKSREDWLARITKGMNAEEFARALTEGGSSDAQALEKLEFVPASELRSQIEKYTCDKVAGKLLPVLPERARYAILKCQGYPSTSHWLFVVLGQDKEGPITVLFRAVENWGCFVCAANDITIE
jgi:hypothetical protein